jgi:opacity protein-like surface antigen
MKHRLLFAAAATALMAAPTLASAQDSGVYIKAQAGYGIVNDADISLTNAAPAGLVGDVAGEGNLALALGLGYDFGNNWRLELDASTLYNDLGAIGGQPSSKASIHANTLMLNALYDFDDFGRWSPFVGAGIGVAEGNVSLSAQDFVNDLGNVIVANPACVSPPVGARISRACVISDTDKNLAWNLIAGVGYSITDNLTWDTNYRYVNMGDIDVEGTYVQANVPGVGGLFNTATASVENVSAHMLMTGFRYRFGDSTPPAPVYVPPPPPKTYMCDDGVTEVTDITLCPVQTVICWDGVTEVTDLGLCPAEPVMVTCSDGVTMVSDLAACPIIALCPEQFRQELIYYEFDKGQSAETRNTINRIMDVGQFCNIDSVRVVGHTDTSGSAAYNMGLSDRRATDAREELVRQGVNAAIISSEGKGETEPFVQTGDGVRERLNRRTEVLITLSEVGTAMMSY